MDQKHGKRSLLDNDRVDEEDEHRNYPDERIKGSTNYRKIDLTGGIAKVESQMQPGDQTEDREKHTYRPR